MGISNINISPNIYVRTSNIVSNDVEYVKRVTGPKRLGEIRKNLDALSAAKLTEVQKRIVQQSTKCANAKDGQTSFGPVMTEYGLDYLCRCEYQECPYFERCMSYPGSKRIKRDTTSETLPKENDDELQKFLKQLGITITDTKFEIKRNKNITEELPKENINQEYTKPEEPVTLSPKKYEYQLIENSDCIINAPIDSHIILNSGPGTGKTYTIIQRLIYILQNNLCPAEEIYILCYTRSAKKVVEDKLDEAVMNGTIPASAKNICVLTFDSYATYFLMALQEFEEVDYDNCGYNDRINLFNKNITQEDFEGISYFIVDEIQDLVNERAQMVLNILKNLKCGYLLAGDRCQSIYDYEADKDATLDSVKFYKLVEDLLPLDTQRYEISVNRRQSSALASDSAAMREVLLHKSIREQNEYASSIISRYAQDIKIEKYIKTLHGLPDCPTAILCRNNGEAEYISGLLCKQGIVHTLNRGVNNVTPLPRWIADVFWDYCRETITKNDFIDRFTFRCNSKLEAEYVWSKLCDFLESDNNQRISLSKMTTALAVVNNVPKEFYDELPTLSVSTIHKAKGSEFDRVILVDSEIEADNSSSEEARVRYVALTRPKNQLVTMKKNQTFFKKSSSGRVVRVGIHNYGKANQYCRNIVLGLSGDIDCNSFASGDFESIIDLQEYIITNVKMYDEITVVLSSENDRYDVVHNGRIIGKLSAGMSAEIKRGLEATDYKYNMPSYLTELYVSGITTEILKKFDSTIPEEYQKSKICFGIQITGLGKLNFEKG